jgi:putative aldouronate transport system substrate-binding protein
MTLAALMVTASAGCGGNPSSEPPAASTDAGGAVSTENSEAPATEDGPLTPYADPVKISWGVQSSQVQVFMDGATYDDNQWSKKIKDDLNIDLEVAFSADITTDAYKNKLNSIIASGDLPDVFRWDDRTLYKQLYENGDIMDITDVFNKYASDGVKEYQTKFPESFEGARFDGRLYAFPYMNDNFHQVPYLWIRDDWLANLNAQPPTTVEEMIALARRFKNEDPDGNGIADTYGLGVNKNVVIADMGTLTGLLSAYGIPGRRNTAAFYRRDGKITFAYIQPEAKEALAVARDMYAEGLLDTEFIVKDTSVLEQDVASGKLGMMYHMNWGTWYPFNLTFESEGVITRPYPIPKASGYDYKVAIEDSRTGDLFMVSAKCKNPEAIIKILNLYYETVEVSNNPDDFTTYWDNEQYRLCPIYVGIPTELYANDVFALQDSGDSGENLAGMLKNVYGFVINFANGTDTSPSAYGTWGMMFENGSMGIALKNYRKDNAVVTNIMAGEIPDIWMQNSGALGTMVDTAYTDIIIGNKPLDYFDQFVSEWLTAGGQQTLDELEKLYPAN